MQKEWGKENAYPYKRYRDKVQDNSQKIRKSLSGSMFVFIAYVTEELMYSVYTILSNNQST